MDRRIPLYLKCTLIDKLDVSKLSPVNEGIDLDYGPDGIKVSYNASHTKGINGNLEDNPTIFDLSVPAIKIQDGIVPVYSLLQRTKMPVVAGSSDGNPFVYAMKQENGYKFASDYDKQMVQNAIKKVF